MVLNQLQRRLGRRALRPLLEPLEDRTMLDAAFGALATVVNTRLDALQVQLTSVATSSVNLPVLNGKLQDISGSVNSTIAQFQAFLQPVLSSLNSKASEKALQAALYPKLDQSGFLRDLNGDGTTQDDRVLTKDPITGAISIEMNVGMETAANKSFRFGLGLPGLPMDVSGGLKVKTGFAYNHLTFGLDASGNPSFGSPIGELQATVHANFAPNTIISGRLGFLSVLGTDTGTNLDMTLSMPATDSGLGTPVLDGTAVVSLALKTSFTSATGTEQSFAYPGISTNFYMSWNFVNSDPNAPIGSFGNDPIVEFRDVSFEAGTFLSNVLRPIIRTLEKSTEPLKPILDLIDQEIPGLSNLSRDAGLGPTSLFSLAKFALTAPGAVPPDYKALVDMALTLHEFRIALEGVDQYPAVVIPIGTYSLSGMNIRNTVAAALDSPGNLTDLIPLALQGVDSIRNKINAVAPAAIKNLFNNYLAPLKNLQNSAGLSYPLFDDPKGGVFKLLLGQDVDFITFTGRFHFDAYETELIPLPIPILGNLIKARLNGQISADAYIKFGYDTYGLRRFLQTLDGKQLANGLYFDGSQDLIRMNGSISAGVALDAPLPLLSIPIPGIFIPVPIRPVFSVNGTLAAEDIRVAFNTSQARYRIFEQHPQPFLETKGLITSQFTFAAEVGVPGVKMIELYRAGLSDKVTELDLYNGPFARPANPFDVPTAAPPVKQVIGLDLNRPLPFDGRVVGNDGLADRISVYVAKGYLWVFIDDGVTDAPAITPVLLSKVKSLTIIGSDDDESLTVNGAINIPVTFLGGAGHNEVELQDQGTKLDPIPSTYILGRTGITRTGFIGLVPKTMQVNFSDIEHITLDTADSSPNTVIIGELHNQKVDLNLGAMGNNVIIDTTDGGPADEINVVGNVGHDSVAVIDTNTKDSPFFFYSAATYTLTADRLVRNKLTPALAPPSNPFFDFPLSNDSTTTINYRGIESFSVKGGDLGNTFHVEGTAQGVSYSLTGGSGVDQFVLGADVQRLGFLRHSSLRLDGGGNLGDSLLLDDSLSEDPGGYFPVTTYTVSPSSVSYNALIADNGTGNPVVVNSVIDYTGFQTLTVKGGSASNFNVFGTLSVLVPRLDGSGGYDEVGQTNLVGAGHTDFVNVYATQGNLDIDVGAGVNYIRVGGGAGLDDIAGFVNVHGQGGQNFLQISDDTSKATVAQSYFVEQDSFLREGTARIFYRDLNTLTIDGANSGGDFSILDTPAGASTVIRGGDANDFVTVLGTSGPLRINLHGGVTQLVKLGDQTHSLDAIRGVVDTIGAGLMDVIISNEASTQAQVAKIGVGPGGVFVGQTFIRQQLIGNQYVTLNTFNFAYLGQQDLTYHAGQGGDVMFVNGTPANSTTFLIHGTGFDTFWVETDHPACLGAVNVYADPTVGEYSYYYDYLNPAPQSYTVSSVPDPGGPDIEVVQRGGAAPVTAPVTFYGLQQIIFYTPLVGGSTVDVQALPQRMYLNMVDAPQDVVTFGHEEVPGQGWTLQAIQGALAIQGTGHISVTFDDSGNPAGRNVVVHPKIYPNWDSIAGLCSQFIMDLDASSVVTILGGQGDDTYSFDGTDVTPAIRIDGGGGTNTLDYSAVTDSVYVNLQTGEASGLKGGIANIQNVTGGAGNNILVGNGANVLTGGAGFNILIAGGAAGSGLPLEASILFAGSTLIGGAGEDLLIGGVTVYDTDKAALDALMAVWSGPEPYSTRVSNLQSGLLAPGKVFWNGLQNTLNGQAGLDLYFGSAANDLYTTKPGEVFVGV